MKMERNTQERIKFELKNLYQFQELYYLGQTKVHYLVDAQEVKHLLLKVNMVSTTLRYDVVQTVMDHANNLSYLMVPTQEEAK